MKKTLVSIIAGTVLLNMVLPLYAGGSSTGSASQGPKVVRFWQAGADSANATNVMSELITQFMTKNPNTIVEYQAYPWANEPHTVFQTAIAGDDVADLLVVGSPFDFVLAGGGHVLPLDSYLDNSTKNDLMDVFAKECVYYGSNSTLNNKFISMPLFGDARTILYNKTIFDAAGVPYPDTSWTHTQFIENARRLTGTYDGKKVYGFGTSARYTSQYLPFIWNYGGNILNSENTKAVIDNAWRRGISEYLTFFAERLTPPGSEAMSLADTLNMFLNGEIAMMVATSDYVRTVQSSTTFNAAKLGVGLMPHVDERTSFAGADVMVIPAIAKYPKEAGDLINFLLQTDNQLKYATTVGFFPAVKSAADNPYYKDEATRSVFADAVNHGRFYVKASFSAGVTPILTANIQNLIAGRQSLDQYLVNMQTELDALIAENN
jgi:multiple sugar transport system substrate-binding protein